MITAKNYAAQAERGLILFAGLSEVHESDREFAKSLSGIIRDSAHFVIPDNGVFFDDELKGLEGKMIELPYGSITVEFYLSSKLSHGKPGKAIVVAVDNGDGIIVFAAVALSGTEIWTPVAHKIRVPKDVNMTGERSDYESECRVACPGILKKVGEDESHSQILYFEWCIEELIEALSCKNISTANYQDASPVNGKRIMKGKLPFYETKVLVIDTRASSTDKAGNGGSHASPRQHLRRGHIRRLPNGNIWVNSCVVGDSAKGIVRKQYSVV